MRFSEIDDWLIFNPISVKKWEKYIDKITNRSPITQLKRNLWKCCCCRYRLRQWGFIYSNSWHSGIFLFVWPPWFRWSFFRLVAVRSLILSESINKKTPLLEAESKLELFFIIQSIVRGFRGISRLTTTKNVSRFISIFNWMPIFVTCLIIMSNELVFDQPKSTKWKSFQNWLKLDDSKFELVIRVLWRVILISLLCVAIGKPKDVEDIQWFWRGICHKAYWCVLSNRQQLKLHLFV